MARLRFTGRVFPDSINITIQGHPRLHTVFGKTGPAADFDASIINNAITIDVEVHAEDPEPYLQFLIQRVFHVAQAATSLLSFQRGEALTVVIDKIESENGEIRHLRGHDEELARLSTAVSSDADFVQVLSLLLLEPNLFLAVRDLADAAKYFHSTPLNSARAVETIRGYFDPEHGGRNEGWAAMRRSLNVSREYLSSITDISRGPRHGRRRTTGFDPEERVSGLKAWTVMNRFLEFKKRNSQPLPLSEFPLLD